MQIRLSPRIFLRICVLITLFLLVAVMPVSAYLVRTNIGQGATIFIGESGLDLTQAINGIYYTPNSGPLAPKGDRDYARVGWWASAATLQTTSPTSGAVALSGYTDYTISPATFGTMTGNWYLINQSTGYANLPAIFTVSDPTLSLDIWDFGSTTGAVGLSATGKSITQGEYLGFKIDTNMWQALSTNRYAKETMTGNYATTDGYIDIKFIDPTDVTHTGLLNGSISSGGFYNTLLQQNVSYQSPNWIWGTAPSTYNPAGNGLTTGTITLANWSTSALDASNQYKYPPGTYTVYAESHLNGMKDNYKMGGADYTGKTISAVATVTLVSESVKIEANKDTVVRSKSFSVTVTGKPKAIYHIWVKGVKTMSGGYDDQPPMIRSLQVGVMNDTASPNSGGFSNSPGPAGNYLYQNGDGKTIWQDVAYPSYTSENYAKTQNGTLMYANITMSTSGTRTVEWATTNWTKAQTYTIRVEQQFSGTADEASIGRNFVRNTGYYLSDEVNVKVEKGVVTIVAAGSQSYYLGEEIKFSGTNTETYTTYLFIMGPNQQAVGSQIQSMNPRANPVVNGNAATFQTASVLGDNTWSWKWGTPGVALDAGTYTIYAVSAPNDYNHLTNTAFGTVSIIIKKPFISANATHAEIALGEKVTIYGTAQGQPTLGVKIWILGKNYFSSSSVTVNADASFRTDIDTNIGDFENNTEYYVLLQHPMQNNVFDIYLNTDDNGVYNRQETPPEIGTKIFSIQGAGSLQGADAAEALIQGFNSPNVDDTYSKVLFKIGNASSPVTPAIPDIATSCYDVSSISIDPMGSLAPITPVTVSYKVDASGFPSGDDLQFFTELESPKWTYTITVNGVDNLRPSAIGKTLTITGFELAYKAGDLVEVRTTLEGKAPTVTQTVNKTIIRIQEMGSKGAPITSCTIDKTQRVLIPGTYPEDPNAGIPFDNIIHLAKGWNFISTPIKLAPGANNAQIFSGVDLAGHSIYIYNAQTATWKTMTGTDTMQPLEGIWVYSNSVKDIEISPDTNPLQTPPTKKLYAGWNAIGSTGIYPATTRDTLFSVSEKWTTLLGYNSVEQRPDISVINGGSGIYADTRTMSSAQGYWLFMKSSGGDVAAISS